MESVLIDEVMTRENKKRQRFGKRLACWEIWNCRNSHRNPVEYLDTTQEEVIAEPSFS